MYKKNRPLVLPARNYSIVFLKKISSRYPGTDEPDALNTATNDIVIIGGGLAGLVSAIHLSGAGLRVTLIEKNEYPKHKVCGEYISNEVLPYLQHLGADPFSKGAKKINRFLLSTTRGKTIETKLPLGGFGISRYTLDHFLLQKALQNGCAVLQQTVTDVTFNSDLFHISTKEGTNLQAKTVIGAFGKRSNMDVTLNRSFISNRSPFVAVKTHMRGSFPDDMVALHNFDGGYCGLSQVENGNINVCFISNYKSFQQYRNIETFKQQVMFRNSSLRSALEGAEPVFAEPLSISQVSFSNKSTIENHMLMCGDAAGMIHPLCGNGMAMAIHSAKIASELLIDYFGQKIKSRRQLEETYTRQWNEAFKNRINTGRILQAFFGKDNLARMLMYGLTHIPGVLPTIIRQTHGKPLNVS
jgi:menaquinone-9 beta-reductase